MDPTLRMKPCKAERSICVEGFCMLICIDSRLLLIVPRERVSFHTCVCWHHYTIPSLCWRTFIRLLQFFFAANIATFLYTQVFTISTTAGFHRVVLNVQVLGKPEGDRAVGCDVRPGQCAALFQTDGGDSRREVGQQSR